MPSMTPKVQSTCATAMILLLANTSLDTKDRQMALTWLRFIERHNISVAPHHMTTLRTMAYNHVPRSNFSGLTYRAIYASLNPLLESAEEIANRLSVSTSWVSGARRDIRKLADPDLRNMKHATNFTYPIDPNTSLHYCETLGVNPAHFNDYLYIFRAQAWACGLFADYLTQINLNYCEVSNITVAQFRTYQHTEPRALGFEYLTHHDSRLRTGITLLCPGQNMATDHFTRTKLLNYLNLDNHFAGTTGHRIQRITSRLAQPMSVPEQGVDPTLTQSNLSGDALDDEVREMVASQPTSQPMKG